MFLCKAISKMRSFNISCVVDMYIQIRGFPVYYLIISTYCQYKMSNVGSLRNRGMLILRIYFVVDGMPIEMYGESWIAGLLTSDYVMLYMAGVETTRGI